MHYANRARTIVSALLISLASGGAQAARNEIKLPDLYNSSDAIVNPTEAKRYGQQLLQLVQLYGGLVDDSLVEEYIRSIGYSLVANSEQPDGDFTFFVLRDKSINAFATFGGYVAVHSGLLLAAHSESELAAVMSHEIAHVTQGHLSRSIEAQQKISLPILLASIAAAIASPNADVAQGALLAGQAALQQARINFTRANEFEADRVGIRTLYLAGYDTRAMAGFFEKLAALSRSYAAKAVPEQLRTHPVTTDRIAEAKNRAARFPQRNLHDQAEFLQIQNRIRVLTSSNPESVAAMLKDRAAHEQDVERHDADRYGYALALIRMEKPFQAIKVLQSLLDKVGESRVYKLAMADALMRGGQQTDALAYYSEMASQYPGNEAVNFAFAKALNKAGHYESAEKKFYDLVWQRQSDASLREMLAHAAENAGHHVLAKESIADSYALSGRIRDAITQYESLLKMPETDYYTRARVGATLIDLRQTFAKELSQRRSRDGDDDRRRRRRG